MTLTIPANDHGHIRVFASDSELPKDVTDKMPGGLAGVFGVSTIDPTYIDVVRISDLEGLLLSDYIMQGYDMPTDPADLAAVNGINGYAILMLSRATGGEALTLKPAPGIRHVATYTAAAQVSLHQPLPDASAKGIIPGPAGKPPKSDARIGGMVATVALVVMFALVWLMVWVAG